MDYNRPGKQNNDDLFYSLDVHEFIIPAELFPLKRSIARVYGMEGFVEPHIHICTNGYSDICIKLYKNEYFGKPTRLFDGYQCMIIDKFMHDNWEELNNAWDSSDGNIVYSKWETPTTCPNYIDSITIDNIFDAIIPDTIDLPIGNGRFKIANPLSSGLIVNIDVLGYNSIRVNINETRGVVIVCDPKINRSFREEIYNIINNKIRWGSPINNPYLYLYQYIAMHALHVGKNNDNNYKALYYNNKKMRFIFE